MLGHSHLIVLKQAWLLNTRAKARHCPILLFEVPTSRQQQSLGPQRTLLSEQGLMCKDIAHCWPCLHSGWPQLGCVGSPLVGSSSTITSCCIAGLQGDNLAGNVERNCLQRCLLHANFAMAPCSLFCEPVTVFMHL